MGQKWCPCPHMTPGVGDTGSLGSRSGPPRSSLVPGLGGVLLTCGQHMLICKPNACRATTGLGEGWPSHSALALSPACPHVEGGATSQCILDTRGEWHPFLGQGACLGVGGRPFPGHALESPCAKCRPEQLCIVGRGAGCGSRVPGNCCVGCMHWG